MASIHGFFTAVGLCTLTAFAALAQTSAPLAFEVATVKPSAPVDVAALKAGKAHTGTKIDGARVDIGTASLSRLICTAYRVRPYQVSGPEWLKTTTFDIQAKMPDGATAEKVPEMLQTLLAERFGLKIRHDSKEQPVYALVVAKNGPKLKESPPAAATPPAVPDSAPPPEKAPDRARRESIAVPTAQGEVKLTPSGEGVSIEMPGKEISGKIRASINRDAGGQPPKIHLESSQTSMKTFAEMLSVGVVDKPVVDMTGLTGDYEIAVDLSADDAMNVVRSSISFLPQGGNGGGGNSPGGVASDPTGASIFSSIQNMGLKLEARKLPLDMLVIEHIEKSPTEN